eukprot:10968202-Alexandrium_andersonii.AAC.1
MEGGEDSLRQPLKAEVDDASPLGSVERACEWNARAQKLRYALNPLGADLCRSDFVRRSVRR